MATADRELAEWLHQWRRDWPHLAEPLLPCWPHHTGTTAELADLRRAFVHGTSPGDHEPIGEPTPPITGSLLHACWQAEQAGNRWRADFARCRGAEVCARAHAAAWVAAEDVQWKVIADGLGGTGSGDEGPVSARTAGVDRGDGDSVPVAPITAADPW
ncbi:MAG TPA: hypothetical protein VMW47_11060 [Verrucomicrobiae bacterium]|nr:hypothetical protein [Verrucomicrobiae bacterium]